MILVVPVATHGFPMLRLWPKLAFWAVPEKVIDRRFSTPIVFDAFTTTAAAFCATTPIDSHAVRATIKVAPTRGVRAMGPPQQKEEGRKYRIIESVGTMCGHS